jgi:2,3-bisphosphoglycerate-dependent phosphoglycerate mutase
MLRGTTVYMVRHAESPFSLENERNRGLSARGFKDAAVVTEILKHKNIQAVVSSPYVRAIQTVQGLADELGLPIELYEDLRERPLAGLDYVIEEKDFMPAIERSFAETDFCLPGGESNQEAQRRGITALQRVIETHQGKNVAIGTHGNIMTIMMNYYDNSIGLEFWKQTSKPDIYQMELDFNDKLISMNRIWGKQ